MTQPPLPAEVSKWELAGVPAAVILGALYKMEMLPQIIKNDLPSLMIIAYMAVALIRAVLQRKAKTDTMTGIRQTRTDIETQ